MENNTEWLLKVSDEANKLIWDYSELSYIEAIMKAKEIHNYKEGE